MCYSAFIYTYTVLLIEQDPNSGDGSWLLLTSQCSLFAFSVFSIHCKWYSLERECYPLCDKMTTIGKNVDTHATVISLGKADFFMKKKDYSENIHLIRYSKA